MRITEMANFVYVRQKGPYGNGTPLINVRNLIGNEPFIYTWSDEFIAAEPSRFKQLLSVYEQYGCSVLASLRATKDEDYDRYGFAGGTEIEPGLLDAKVLVEKGQIQVEINEEKSRTVDLVRGESFGFLGFDFRRVRSRAGKWRPQ